MHAEEIENIKRQKEQAAEAARQLQIEAEAAAQQLRQEQEAQRIEQERQRVEQERQRIEQQKQDTIANLRYKKEGKAITIIGIKRSFSGEVNIPEEIEGLPVTKIAPFAFYQKENIEKFVFPSTLKEIGQGAFAHTGVQKRAFLPAGCKIGKNAFFNSNVRR